jgi:HK97 family phage major capsid protein
MRVEAIKAGLLEIHEQVEAIQNRADSDAREMTAEERKSVLALHEQFDALEQELKQREKSEAVKARLAEPTGRKTDPNPPGQSMIATPLLSGGRLMAQLFPNAPRERSPFPSFGEFAFCAAMNVLDPRLRTTTIQNAAMSEGVGAEGGFGVPTEHGDQLMDGSLEREVIRPRCNVLPFSSYTLSVPMWDYTDGTSNARAGLTLTWQAEAATASYQAAKLAIGNMRAHKGSIYVAASNELAEDMPAFSRRLEVAMINAIAAGLDYAFVFGDGVGKPLGIMHAPSLITVSKESGQAADTIVEANILKAAARLHPSCWANSVWLASPTALAQLLALSQATGPNAGGRTALFTERDGSLFMLTRPVIVTDACAPLGGTGDLIFCDLSKYVVALRREARLESSIHAKFDTDQLAVRMVLRVDGQPEWPAPRKLRDGVSTMSAFVCLEARA